MFYKQIRCALELTVAMWVPGLTQAENKQIERVQKCALYVIMGEEYKNYESAVRILGVDKLSDRRSKLCLNFAKKSEKHPKYKNWFDLADQIEPPTVNTRSDKTTIQTKYKPVPCRTDRYHLSPLPFMTDLLNAYYDKKK